MLNQSFSKKFKNFIQFYHLPKFVGTPCTTDPTAHLSSPLNMGNFNNCKKSLRIRCKSSFGFGTTATNAHLDNHLFLATFWKAVVTTCEFLARWLSNISEKASQSMRHDWFYICKGVIYKNLIFLKKTSDARQIPKKPW